MKLNKETLKQIIKEELGAVMREDRDKEEISTYQQAFGSPNLTPLDILFKNPDMTVEEFRKILVKALEHKDFGGYDDFNQYMNELVQQVNYYPDDARSKIIRQVLEDPEIKAKREKANAERKAKQKARAAARYK